MCSFFGDECVFFWGVKCFLFFVLWLRCGELCFELVDLFVSVFGGLFGAFVCVFGVFLGVCFGDLCFVGGEYGVVVFGVVCEFWVCWVFVGWVG